MDRLFRESLLPYFLIPVSLPFGSLFLTVQLCCVFVEYFAAYILYYFSTINQSNLGFCTILQLSRERLL